MPRPRTLVPALVSFALLLAACGDDGGDTASTTTTTSTVPSSTVAPGSSTTLGTVPANAVAASVFFGRDGLVATAGRAVEAPAVARGALTALLDGPTAFEEGLGMSSAIPEGTRLLDIEVVDGVATVDLSGEFLDDLGEDTVLRVAEVVFTLTQFPTVDRVTILVEETPTPTVGFDAVPVEEVDREDFESVTPLILVASPTPGAAVAAPVQVSGIANTFEANVQYEVTGPDGSVLDDGFTTASAGTGAWGTFSFTTSPPAGDAVITVFEESAEDGSRINEYPVPVTVR
jgi:germination protein M